jgi:hypothetical protein
MRWAAAPWMLMLVIGCAGSRAPSPPAPPGAPPPPALFELRVGFWVNLHQRLYAESGPRPPPDRLQPAAAEDRERWERAVEWYRRRYPDRRFLTLLEHDELVRANRELARAGAATALAAGALPPELRATLEEAAPVYRRQRWPADEQAGRDFQQRLAPRLADHGRALAAAHARAYATPWPDGPVAVDVAAYAGPVGAYTVLEPTHITMASADRRHAGDAALEILFHEAAHALVRRIEGSIARACAARGRPVPPTLWHAVLFYTTGELMRRELGPDYTPYAHRLGLYARDPTWTAAEPLLARHWRDYLDGRSPLDAAIDRIVAELPDSMPQTPAR